MNDEAKPISVADDRWLVAGPLTMDSAAGVLAASTELALPGAGGIDLERVDPVDSAGVAVLLAWQRRAHAEGKTLTFTAVPKSLASLAELYGVEGLIAP